MSDIYIYIEEHGGFDKSFEFSFEEFSAQVDYDDVDHTAVDAATEVLAELVKEHWDEEKYNAKYKEKLLEEWEKNEYALQNDYNDLEDFLTQRGVK